MGNSLIAFAEADEMLAWQGVYDRDSKGQPVRLADLYRDHPRRLHWRTELLPLHPDAFYKLVVTVSAVLKPPGEPRDKKRKAWRKAHTEAVLQSLQAFLTGQLAGLAGDAQDRRVAHGRRVRQGLVRGS